MNRETIIEGIEKSMRFTAILSGSPTMFHFVVDGETLTPINDAGTEADLTVMALVTLRLHGLSSISLLRFLIRERGESKLSQVDLDQLLDTVPQDRV
jgi:hypothetical protein